RRRKAFFDDCFNELGFTGIGFDPGFDREISSGSEVQRVGVRHDHTLVYPIEIEPKVHFSRSKAGGVEQCAIVPANHISGRTVPWPPAKDSWRNWGWIGNYSSGKET